MYNISCFDSDVCACELPVGMATDENAQLCVVIQIKSEAFLEDLNNILNSGDVPNVYAQDELDNIYTQMKAVIQDPNFQPTKTNLFSTYTKRVRTNLHTVITMRFD